MRNLAVPMLSISILSIVLACAHAPQSADQQKTSFVMCEALKKRGQTLDPEDITNGFIKGDGKIMYAFLRWTDLIPNRSYQMRWDWYDPNNYLAGRNSKDTRSRQKTRHHDEHR
jgi:hypothetical protein